MVKENIEIKIPIIIGVAGVCISIGADYNNSIWMWSIGMGLAIAGIVTIGQRLYRRMQIKGVNKV